MGRNRRIKKGRCVIHKTEGEYNSSGYFVDGPPGTRVEKNWLNAVQDEISNVVLNAGYTLNTAATETGTQLYTAINSLISSASIYATRAWVNFNGTGTVTIRASGNVTSITDNGTGDYTVNFTSAMSDTNYAVSGTICIDTPLTSFDSNLTVHSPATVLTSSVRVFCSEGVTSGLGEDGEYIAVVITR